VKGRWVLSVGFLLGGCGLVIVILLMMDELIFGGTLGFR